MFRLGTSDMARSALGMKSHDQSTNEPSLIRLCADLLAAISNLSFLRAALEQELSIITFEHAELDGNSFVKRTSDAMWTAQTTCNDLANEVLLLQPTSRRESSARNAALKSFVQLVDVDERIQSLCEQSLNRKTFRLLNSGGSPQIKSIYHSFRQAVNSNRWSTGHAPPDNSGDHSATQR